MKTTLNIFFSFFFAASFAQVVNSDSLLKRLKNTAPDSVRVNLLIELSNELSRSKADKAKMYAEEALALAHNLSFEKGEAEANSILALVCYSKGDFGTALILNETALKIRIKLNDKYGMAGSYANISNNLRKTGNYARAVEYQLRSLKLREEMKDEKAIGDSYSSLGNIYYSQGNFKQAEEYNRKALGLYERSGDKVRVAAALNNLGAINANMKRTDSALYFMRRAIELKKDDKDLAALASIYNNMGSLYSSTTQYDSAFFYLDRSEKIFSEKQNKFGIAQAKLNKAVVYVHIKNHRQAIQLFLSSFAIAKEIGSLVIVSESANGLSKEYETTEKHTEALAFYKEYIAAKDSMTNEQNTKKTIHAQMQYDFDKKSAADSIKNVETKKFEDVKHKQEIARQKTFTYGGIAGFLVMIIVAGISYLAFRNKRSANIEIARQKMMVEEKQKEILDSIYYAKRIQVTLLTSEKYIARKLNALKKKR